MTYDFEENDPDIFDGIAGSSVALVSSLNSHEPRRTPLTEILRQVVDESNIETRIVPFPALQNHSESSRPTRLLVDLWSNGKEQELRNTAGVASTLVRSAAAHSSVDVLVCVFPARPNIRIFKILQNTVSLCNGGNHFLQRTPRVEAFGNTTIRSTTGLRASLFSFLSVS